MDEITEESYDDLLDTKEIVNDDKQTEQSSKKAIKITEEKEKLLSNLKARDFKTLRDKVAYILNNNIEARNSDIELAWAYWKTFESEIFNTSTLTKNQFKELSNIASLRRVRAKIQNEFKLFQADEEVRKFRGTLSQEYKNESISDKPEGQGLYSVYVDETGKTQQYLTVGSLWILEEHSSIISRSQEMENWLRYNGITYEFHFSEFKDKNRLSAYKGFFDKFLSTFPSISFKTIMVKKEGISDTNQAIIDLTYHLIKKGIDHENETKRAPLPRMLQLWIDNEEKGSDAIKLQNLRERIDRQKMNGLFLDSFTAVSSLKNYFIQITDIFTGAINRKLNTPDGSNHKDELARYILDTLGLTLSDNEYSNNIIDNSTVFNLR